MAYIIKVIISAIMIVAISEAAKRSSLFGALIASLPIVSLLALFWLYWDTKNIPAIAALSKDIFWLVIPSLAFFLSLPLLLKYQLNFYLAVVIAAIITVVCYLLMFSLLLKKSVIH